MKDQYTGDIADFGKLGLLRAAAAEGLKVGVNWMLTPPDESDAHGSLTGYLDEGKMRDADPALFDALRAIVRSGDRRAVRLETPEILRAKFYHEPLDYGERTPAERKIFRREWHRKGLEALAGCDLVLLDPDVGLMVPSAENTRKNNQYVTPEELRDYYAAGAGICCYQHQARRVGRFYLAQLGSLLESGDFPEARPLALRYNPGPHRYYFFLLHPEQEVPVRRAVDRMLEGGWKDYFSLPQKA